MSFVEDIGRKVITERTEIQYGVGLVYNSLSPCHPDWNIQVVIY